MSNSNDDGNVQNRVASGEILVGVLWLVGTCLAVLVRIFDPAVGAINTAGLH